MKEARLPSRFFFSTDICDDNESLETLQTVNLANSGVRVPLKWELSISMATECANTMRNVLSSNGIGQTYPSIACPRGSSAPVSDQNHGLRRAELF